MSNCFDKCLIDSLVILKLPTSCSYICIFFIALCNAIVFLASCGIYQARNLGLD